MDIYNEWGFQKNPFETKPLTPDENGQILLVDRKEELGKIKIRLSSSSNIVTIEGANGVGKTSLINIAAFQLFDEYLKTGTGSFFMPCDVPFQLTPEIDTEKFIDDVLMSIAQTLIKKGQLLNESGFYLEGNKSINNWLNSPLIKSNNGSLNTPIGGLGFGNSSGVNTSTGFQRSGFRIAILNWLKEIFPYDTYGGVVCIIDNLELLQTSDAAKRQLEQLRDTLFGYIGLRWVLCGSLGIVHGVASSPRLQGRMFSPIEIMGIKEEYASKILSSRMKAFEINNNGYLPLTGLEFVHLYKILNNNIRNTLNYVNNYCIWIADHHLQPDSNQKKEYYFCQWLKELSIEKVDAINLQIGNRAKGVFIKSIEFGGEFSPSDFVLFDFKSLPAMRPHIYQLEKVGLVTSTIDESDKRRKTIQVTPEGWFFIMV